MPPPLRGSLESLTRQNEKTEADNLERIEDDSDLNDRIERGMLVPVPVSTALCPVLQPYVAHYTGLALLSGGLGFKGDIERDAKGGLTVTADTDITRLRTVDDELRMDFIKWDRLTVAGIRYQSDPAALSIRSMRAQARMRG